MGQLPYFPPNVAGWEYGAAFMTTNAALNRWGFGSDLVNRTEVAPTDIVGETPQAALDRAYGATGRPWLAAPTRAAMLDYATPRARREQHEQASATALAAGNGSLRPRQPGDVSR